MLTGLLHRKGCGHTSCMNGYPVAVPEAEAQFPLTVLTWRIIYLS